MTGDSQRMREHKGLSIVLARGRHNGQSGQAVSRRNECHAKRYSAWACRSSRLLEFYVVSAEGIEETIRVIGIAAFVPMGILSGE